MAYREVTMIEIKEVLRRWLLGAGKKAIARQVGVARNTVRRHIEAAEACGMASGGGAEQLTDGRLSEVVAALQAGDRAHGEGWDLCAAQREVIVKKLGDRVRLTKVRKLLARQGVVVAYATLYRYAVAELGFGRGAPTIPVSDGEPGKELQLDTGWMTHLEPDETGRRRRFRAWIFTAVVSRHRFVYPTFRETTADAIEACEAAWAFFGGVFGVVIPDNTKAIVKKVDPLEPLINRAFLEYAQKRGFVIDPARARAPKDKARVERSVVPAREDCFGGEVLHTIGEARQLAVSWCRQEYGMRRHTRTQRLPLEHFEAEEKAKLLPAPTEPYDVPLWSEPKVPRDQHAQVAKALYSLPRRYRGYQLRARADSTLVRFYFRDVLVKTHPRKPPGGRSTDPTDFPPEQAACAQRDVAFLRGLAAKQGEAVGRFAEALLEGPLPWTRMRRVYALLGLCRRYGAERVDAACARSLEEDMRDVRRLDRMLKLGTPMAPITPSQRPLPFSRYLRPTSVYALPVTRETKGDPTE